MCFEIPIKPARTIEKIKQIEYSQRNGNHLLSFLTQDNSYGQILHQAVGFN
jgi:hypothetical protein